VHVYVHSGECLYVYKYLRLYYISKKITLNHKITSRENRSPKLEESGSWEAAVVREYNVENAVTVKQDSVHDTTGTTRHRFV
jgi:hypothetical protein